MSMTIGARLQSREALREARSRSVLTLSAANAAITRRNSHERAAPKAAEALDEEVNQLVVEQETANLFAIESALLLLHYNPEVYGTCEECGKAISPLVLSVFPWESRCECHLQQLLQ